MVMKPEPHQRLAGRDRNVHRDCSMKEERGELDETWDERTEGGRGWKRTLEDMR